MTPPSDLHALHWGDSGSPVLFLHGLFGQGRNWATVGSALADRHRVTAVDLPHHGRSPWGASFDYLDLAAQVAAGVSVEDPTAVVGHSMGGKVAMALALTRPELVSRLVVADMSPVAYDRASEFRQYTTAMRELDLAAVQRRSEAEDALATSVPNPAVRGFLLQNLRREGDSWAWRPNLEVLDRDLDVIGGWPEAQLDGVAPYDGPVLWLAGERSDYIRAEYADTMRRWFPHVRQVTIKGAGHWVHADRPEVFTEVVRRFIEE